jgi:putative ABC transport system permease protein
MNSAWQDSRYAARQLLKTPGFTAVAVLTLALGIGANTALFSLVYGVLLRPLPYAQPDRIVAVFETESGRFVSPANLIDFREQSKSFEALAAALWQFTTLTGKGEPERLHGLVVSPEFFHVLGVQAELGRAFMPDGDSVTQPTVVLSHGLWQRQFRSDPGILGQVLSLNGVSHAVVGVMPPEFYFEFFEAELWLRAPRGTPEPPIEVDWGRDYMTFRNYPYLYVVGRLESGVTAESAQAEMDTIARRLVAEYPDQNAGLGVSVVPLHEQVVGDIGPALMVLLGAVAFVLLIACANVANLVLARSVSRERELAIRSVLGASRKRLIRQFLTESMILSSLGGGLGLLLAPLGIDALLTFIPENMPRQQEIGVDLWVLGFTLVISFLTALVFGLAPAFRSSRPDLQESLTEGSRATGGRSRRRLQSSLVVAEIALAFVLLIGAGLLMRSFLQLQRVEPGFESQNLLVLTVHLPETQYAGNPQLTEFFRQVLEGINSLPEVRSASAVLGVPLGKFGGTQSFIIEGRHDPPPRPIPEANLQVVTPEYFRTMSIKILLGRDFTPSDGTEASKVAVINQTMSRRFWPNESPLGKRISIEAEEWIEIVGVVSDVKNSGLESEPKPELHFPQPQFPLRFADLVVKTESDPLRFVGAIRSEVRAVDADIPVYDIKTMAQIVGESVARPRFSTLLLGVFAAVALVLAAVGIYALMAYSVSQRTHEIGIRTALGARAPDVYKLVLGHGALLTLIGLAGGLTAALALTRVLSSFLYGVSARDPLTFVGVCTLLAMVALGASYVPARRAVEVDPLVAIRSE